MNQDYFTKAESWALDTQGMSDRSRRTAWLVAGIACGVAAFEAVALAMLAPLKTVEPITLLVDRQTGYVQSLDPASPRRVVADQALTQSFLAQYVMAREGFDRATVSLDYRKVALWSAGAARASYLAAMATDSPSSPFKRFPAGVGEVVRVKSVSQLRPGTALVRFDTWREDPNGRAGIAQPWISVVRYRYSEAPMSLEDRLINPLGFQVLSYRRDAEAPPVAQPLQPAAAYPSPLALQPAADRPATVVPVNTAAPAAIGSAAPAPGTVR